MPLKNDLKDFPELSRKAFQHPLDGQAIAALQNVRGLPTLIKYVSEKTTEQLMNLENITSRLRVDAQQYPSLYKQFLRMAQVLDVQKLPNLYIETSPTINAFAMGMENYSIVLCSGLIDIMEEEELLAILGHELGHVKCEHQLYKTTIYWLTNFGDLILSQAKIPGLDFLLGAGRIAIYYALLDWNRKAEYSCDRAALLAVQDVDAISGALSKLAGFSEKFEEKINIDAVEEQATLYQELGSDSILVKIMKLKILERTHPYTAVRVKEIRNWAQSPEYMSILSGEYQKNNGQPGSNGAAPATVATKGRTCPNPKCNYPCGADFLFCPKCQSNLREARLSCGNCGNAVETEWRICCYCGSTLQGS